MAISSSTFTITSSTATPIASTDNDTTIGTTVWVYLEAHGSSNKCAIGGADVTLSNGIHIYGGEKFGPVRLRLGETLYAISDSAGGLDLRVLETGE